MRLARLWNTHAGTGARKGEATARRSRRGKRPLGTTARLRGQALLRGRRRGNCHPGELNTALRKLGLPVYHVRDLEAAPAITDGVFIVESRREALTRSI
jgi:hypothetical protein